MPITGCPAKGSSRSGVKIRTSACPVARSAGVTNVVSDRLVSRAIRCIVASSSPRASVNTQRAFPASGRLVNTSHWTNRYCGMLARIPTVMRPRPVVCRLGLDVATESIRILIAEDNALLRGVLRDALAEAGMTVVAEAADGAAAVVEAERSNPDVVVMDMRMPNVDGIEATEQIAQAPWAMPVVVLSAYDEPQMIEAALAAGATNCLKKGVGLDELIEAIRSAEAGRDRV